MEDFSYPIKLEPLARPVKRRARAPKRLSLREERERSKVSLKEIARRTRIPLRHLEELERGDISQWPAGVYAKSWARDYAREARINPERVVAIVAPVAEVEPTIEEIKEVREERERARADESPLAPLLDLMRKFAAVIVVVSLIVLAAIFFFMRGEDRSDNSRSPVPVGTTGVTPGPPRD